MMADKLPPKNERLALPPTDRSSVPQGHGKAIYTVTCSRNPLTATVFLLKLDADQRSTIQAKEPIRLEAGTSAGMNQNVTIAGIADPLGITRACAVCGHHEIVICGCGASSCGTRGQSWKCPSCGGASSSLRLDNTTSVTASKQQRARNQHLVAGEKRPALPKS
mgnify:CR=1 FL=1